MSGVEVNIESVIMDRDYYKMQYERVIKENPAMVSLVNVDYMDLYIKTKEELDILKAKKSWFWFNKNVT